MRQIRYRDTISFRITEIQKSALERIAQEDDTALAEVARKFLLSGMHQAGVQV